MNGEEIGHEVYSTYECDENKIFITYHNGKVRDKSFNTIGK
jgi:hypothetical protein